MELYRLWLENGCFSINFFLELLEPELIIKKNLDETNIKRISLDRTRGNHRRSKGALIN